MPTSRCGSSLTAPLPMSLQACCGRVRDLMPNNPACERRLRGGGVSARDQAPRPRHKSIAHLPRQIVASLGVVGFGHGCLAMLAFLRPHFCICRRPIGEERCQRLMSPPGPLPTDTDEQLVPRPLQDQERYGPRKQQHRELFARPAPGKYRRFASGTWALD